MWKTFSNNAPPPLPPELLPHVVGLHGSVDTADPPSKEIIKKLKNALVSGILQANDLLLVKIS